MEEHAIDTTLGRLRVSVGGDGEAILFWPSLLMTGDMWAAQAAHFAATHRVVVIDPPGHGGSAPLRAPFTFTECSDTIVDVLDALGLARAHVVGNSYGGMIGGTFAAEHPDRVGRCVLMNCTASAAGRRQRVEYHALLAAAKALGGIRGPLTGSVLRAFLGPTSLRTRPAVVAAVREAAGAVDVGSSAWAVRSVVPRRPDQRALLAAVRTPVLVVAGAEDATFGTAETRAMADAIAGAAFVVLDGVAHLAALEDPPLVNRLVEDFLVRA